MIKKEPFPHDKQRVSELTEAGRQLYIAAYDKLMNGGVYDMPTFQDKPLQFVPLVAIRNQSPPDDGDIKGLAEDLRIVPGRDFAMGYYDDPLTPSERQNVERTGNLVITDGFRPTDIPIEGVDVTYTDRIYTDDDTEYAAIVDNGGYASIHTYPAEDESGEPYEELGADQADILLAQGTRFATEMRESIPSPAQYRMTRAEARLLDSLGIAADPPVDVYLTLEHHWLVPLNGHETTGWLQDHATAMQQKAARHRRSILKLGALGAPEVFIDNEKRLISEFNAALKRTTDILDKR